MKKRLVKKIKKQKCLPCLVHGIRKPMAEIIEPLIVIREKALVSIEEEDPKFDQKYGKAIDTFWEEMRKAGITSDSDEDNERDAISNYTDGIYEFYRSPLEPRKSYATVYVRELK